MIGNFLGYGYTSATSNAVNPVLYRGYQRVIENARCTRFFIVNQPNHFCAEDTIEGSNICGGDIGGGFVTTTRRENILTGVASISAPCGQPGYFNIFSLYFKYFNILLFSFSSISIHKNKCV